MSFPVLSPYPDMQMRAAIEAETDNFFGRGTGVVPVGTGVPADPTLNLGSKTYFQTDAVFVKEVYAQSSIDCDFLLTMNSPTASGVTANASFIKFPLTAKASATRLVLNQWLQQGCQISGSAMNGGGLSGVITWGFSADNYTADLNFNADKTILWCGDSITRFSAGQPATVTANQNFSFIVRDYYRAKGYDARLVRRAHGGWSTTDFVNYWKTGSLSFPKNSINAVFFALGTNDALLTIPTATTQANLTILMNHFKSYGVQLPVVFVLPTPLNDNTANTRLTATIAAMISTISADTTGQFKYVSINNAFDRTNLANYNTADGIHPIASLHASAMAPIITQYLTDNNIKLL